MIQLERFLGRALGPLLKTGLPLMESVPKSLTNSVLLLLGLTAAASAADATIQKNNFGMATTKLIFPSEKLNNIMEKVQSLEGSGLLINGVSETIASEAKNKNVDFLDIDRAINFQFIIKCISIKT